MIQHCKQLAYSSLSIDMISFAVRHAPKMPTTLWVACEAMNIYEVGVGHRAREFGFKKNRKEGV